MGEGVNDFFENFKNFFKNYRSKKTKFSKIGGEEVIHPGRNTPVQYEYGYSDSLLTVPDY
jgi:hypothetical protein